MDRILETYTSTAAILASLDTLFDLAAGPHKERHLVLTRILSASLGLRRQLLSGSIRLRSASHFEGLSKGVEARFYSRKC